MTSHARIGGEESWAIVHLFRSVAHVWVPGAKTTGPIVKKLGFSEI
jgi:hypothetical protein